MDVGTANEALASGKILVASPVASVTADAQTGLTIMDANASNIQLSQRTNGHLTLKIEGKTYDFTADDYFVESDGSGRIYGYGKDIEVEAESGDVNWVGLFSW